MMTCREFVDFLMNYLDDELLEGQRAVFEQHMIDCPPCVDYLDQYRDAVKMGRSVCQPEAGAPEDAPEALIQAILAARKTEG